MYTNIVKKSLVLLVVYAAIIVGIFILQFRSDSVISEKLGNLHISLAEAKSADGRAVLKNKMLVSFNGISFLSDDEHSATVTYLGTNTKKNVSLVSWTKKSPLSCEFTFSNNIIVRFSLTDDTVKAHLSIKAILPPDIFAFYLPYQLMGGATVISQSDTCLQIGIYSSQWELSAAGIDPSSLALTDDTDTASYTFFDKTKTFSFDAVANIEGADILKYNDTISAFEQNLIITFNSLSQNTSSITEQAAVSFVADMAKKGRYNEALDAVPSSFKKGIQRTYLSAPYFDSLAAMYKSFERQMNNYHDIVSQNKLSAFSVDGIADYLCMHPGADSVKRLLATGAATDEKNITVMDAANILRTYDSLVNKNNDLASILLPVVEKCVSKIASSCAVDGKNITVSENGTFLSVIQAATVGDALIRYGQASGNQILMNGGYLIINSYLSGSSSFDLHTLADIYPIIIHNNSYYPHFVLLGFDNGQAIYAWTCASNIKYEKNDQGSASITIDFPQTYTHYLIINGIKTFKAIYIYDMVFRTDLRFETYNSSGYVYNADTGALLLKSRQKSQHEVIRLMYSTDANESAGKNTFTETDSSGNPINIKESEPSDALPNENIPMSSSNTSAEEAD
ncbi:MAG: hypothetical protein M0P01_04545 [Treponema sp.]|nr:hypothetical protein [Treponema sp.]